MNYVHDNDISNKLKDFRFRYRLELEDLTNVNMSRILSVRQFCKQAIEVEKEMKMYIKTKLRVIS